MSVTLRPWNYEDILAVSALEKRCFGDPWHYKMFADSFLTGIFHGIVAEEEGALVGYAFYTCLYEDADVDKVAVSPEYRRRGVGRMLLAALLSDAKALGATRAMLEVRASNEPAIALYAAEGFRQVAERGKYYGDGETALVLEKQPL